MILWIILHWLAIHLGTENESGVWYGFWSGFGSDIQEFGILAAMVLLFRKHNCHVRHCWRISKHALDGTPYVLCRKHHPEVPDKAPTHKQILDHWKRSKQQGD